MTQDRGCPTCKGPRTPPSENPSYPFCCGRCKLADLGHWLDGRYAIAGEPVAEDDPEHGDPRARYH